MTKVALEGLSERLAALVQEARRGEDVLFTEQDRPVARLVRIDTLPAPRKAGSAKHLPHFMAADFDATPDGFEEYMP